MCQLIEEFGLDVTKPKNLNLNGKKKDPKRQDGDELYETMLHAAAGYCDAQMTRFLIGKGTCFA